jgi:hypothetical protein
VGEKEKEKEKEPLTRCNGGMMARPIFTWMRHIALES